VCGATCTRKLKGRSPRRAERSAMRVVLDTNVLLAALMAPRGRPHQVFQAFLKDRFTLITSVQQLEELSRVTRYPGVRERIQPVQAGNMINAIRA